MAILPECATGAQQQVRCASHTPTARNLNQRDVQRGPCGSLAMVKACQAWFINFKVLRKQCICGCSGTAVYPCVRT